MAGRPRRKAKKITALEAKLAEVRAIVDQAREQMDEVHELMIQYTPDHYHDRRPSELSIDPRGQAWVNASEEIDEAANSIADAANSLGHLGQILQEKAAIAASQEEPVKAEPVATGG